MDHRWLSPFAWAKLTVIGFLLCTGCAEEPKKAENVLSQDKFRDVLLELHLAEAQAMDQSRLTDSVQIQLKGDYLFIFERHGIDKETFFKSFDYYSDRPKELHQIYEEMHARLNIMQDSLLHKEQAGEIDTSETDNTPFFRQRKKQSK